MLEQLTLDVSDSYDPDGTPLTYSWSVTPSDAVAGQPAPRTWRPPLFSHPGLYTFTVTGQDAGGASASIQREAAVYGPEGFSPFDRPAPGAVLDPGERGASPELHAPVRTTR